MTFSIAHIHPMSVHFPVAVIMLGFLAEVLSLLFKDQLWLKKAGFYLLIIGTISAVAAFLTGEFLTDELKGEAGELKEKHEIFAKITMYVMIAASLLKIYLVFKKNEDSSFKWVFFVLYAIAFISVGITGYLGGSLVYDYMIGL
jgi:uncharacterized membrane protein